MSIILDQVRRVDGQLDRVHLVPRASQDGISTLQNQVVSSSRIEKLQSIVKSLSTISSYSPLLSSWRISTLLEQASFVIPGMQAQDQEDDEQVTEQPIRDYEEELEWLLVSKATVQTYGLLLNTLLEQTIPLTDDIWYWDEVLGSYTYTGLYTLQTSPLRLWAWSKDIYGDTRARFMQLGDRKGEDISTQGIGSNLAGQWRQFYGIVRESIQERSVADIQRRVLSPIALCRAEARRNQRRLNRLREMSASGLGVLMDEGLNFDIHDEGQELAKAEDADAHEWKGVVERSVALMDTVLSNITAIETGVSEFEDIVFASVEDDPEISALGAEVVESARPAKISRRLQNILSAQIPKQIATSRALAYEYGRPSRIVRYWLPATILLLSSSTILKILVNRKAEIQTWVRELGVTVRDFWMNWVVEPTQKVIATIRHDKDSEVAIMSKESLKGDRDSLERMVIDFAVDNPAVAGYGSGSLNETQISDIRTKVKEGDLTPVLRAYEKDLQKPFTGTIRGNLIRTLLIQVQKTKVDVEVAISGIDALLKSQELVFGFIGLTPGIIVSFMAFRYLGGVFGSRKGLQQGKKAGQTVRILRNIDRVLTQATPTSSNVLSYKDHGLLLCEVHVLRARAHRLFPGDVEREFLEDVGDLCDINSGIPAQIKVLERIRWAYSRWLR